MSVTPQTQVSPGSLPGIFHQGVKTPISFETTRRSTSSSVYSIFFSQKIFMRNNISRNEIKLMNCINQNNEKLYW